MKHQNAYLGRLLIPVGPNNDDEEKGNLADHANSNARHYTCNKENKMNFQPVFFKFLGRITVWDFLEPNSHFKMFAFSRFRRKH